MSDRGWAMSERDLDRMLAAWLGDRPDAAADRIAEAALLQIATTPQDRAWLQRFVAWGAGSPGVLAATALLVLTLGLGALLLPRLVGDSQPSPTPSPTPTTDPDALLPVVSDAGYSLLIPASWEEVQSEHPDARRWVGSDTELMISYGTSIFEGGQVTVCAPPVADYVDCMTLEHGYSIPLDPEVDGIGPISMEVWLDRCDGGCPTTATETVLDGEVASHERAVIAGRQVTYVATFHDRRPIILYWSEPVAEANEARVEQMLASFRFVDPPTDASQEPFVDPTELVPFGGADFGYELMIPRFWDDTAASPEAGVTTFGSGGGGGTRGDPALTISIGDPDGSVVLCQPACERVVVASLDELQAAVISVPEEFADAVPGQADGDITLGGEPARFERPGYALGGEHRRLGIGAMRGGGNCLGCPGMRYHVYLIRDGRPVVLAFDFWNIAFARMTSDYVAQMIESFRFTD